MEGGTRRFKNCLFLDDFDVTSTKSTTTFITFNEVAFKHHIVEYGLSFMLLEI